MSFSCRDVQQAANRTEHYEGQGFTLRLYLDFINLRLKVIEYKGDNLAGAAGFLLAKAKEHKLGKILFNARKEAVTVLESTGYQLEGHYPKFFNGVDAYGMSCFVDPNRKKSPYWEREEDILRKISTREKKQQLPELPEGLHMRVAGEKDAHALVELYRQVFSTYPSPLLDAGYVKEVMDSNVLFAAIFDGVTPVSAASAEMDMKNKNAELTDCATLPAYRGKGLLTYLLKYLEEEMLKRKFECLYSLARAGSAGMNASLYGLGYKYTGRFINNCHIGGRFEDMNLWVK